MGRRGPTTTYKTRAARNAARRLRYQQQKRAQLLSQETSVPARPRTLLEPVIQPREPRQDADSPPRSGTAPEPAAAPDTLDAGPIPEPHLRPEGSLPLSNDIDFLLDDPSGFDSDGGNALQPAEATIRYNLSAEAIPDDDEPTEGPISAADYEPLLFGIPDISADSGTDDLSDNAYGSGDSDNGYPQSDRLSTGTENLDSLGVRLAQQILQFQGCCPECHQQSMEPLVNQERSSIPTIRLADLQKWHCPQVLGSPRLPDAETTWTKNWSATDRRQLFCGIGNDQETPPVVLITDEEKELLPRDIMFDTDSVTAFIGSLAAARQGIRWQPVQRPVSDLQSSLHLDPLPVEYTDRRSGRSRRTHMPVHKIKHYTLGRVVGMEDASIYVLFPGLSHPRSPTARLSGEDFGTWMDQVFFPALEVAYSGHYLQHYPSSYAHALLNTWAAWKEARSVTTQARQQQLNHFLPPEGLAAIWTAILEIIEQKDLQQFQRPYLLLAAKNLKVATKSTTWLGMQQRFNQTWSSAIDVQHVITMYRDIGKEIFPMAPDQKPLVIPLGH
ncbi:hypothetical protein N7532_002989 [Penicillium argentinense]|uniref:Uncharacterized protein n=1 Tax=Penicillium argentinense TaxID=1131581 RepID=A0A9W9FLM5_9EURO|nr:uncharacterized protein N7532_002989 [Penicillium argentinense]KAJ5102460.1 hypothetical protein N7532_002989 [Penicillium argentinense]